jgi:acyl-CoA reductase-like NAD-dependent aldehyde dehydrogenase
MPSGNCGSETTAATPLATLSGCPSMTFSTSARLVSELAGRNVRLQCELGGKNVSVVLEDADLDMAATTMGPLSYAAHCDGVLGHIERAREEGASVIAVAAGRPRRRWRTAAPSSRP